MKKLTKSIISKRYQIVIPAEIQSKFNYKPGDEVIWSIVGEEVFIRIKRREKIDPIKKLIGRFSTIESDDSTNLLDEVVSKQ